MQDKPKQRKMRSEARKRILLPKAEWKRYRKWRKDIEVGPYRPFFETHQLHSTGRKHKFFCPKQQRIVHLMSDGEYKVYQDMIWRPDVVSIDEQYALDIKETWKICQELKIHHPYEYQRDIHHIMSTDLIVTLNRSGALVKRAHPVKYEIEPGANSRTNNKLKVETAFWTARNIPCEPISAVRVDKNWIKHLDFLSMHYDPSLSSNELTQFSGLFAKRWAKAPKLPLRGILTQIAQLIGVHQFTAEKVFKNAILAGLIPLKAPVPLVYHKPVLLA